MGSPVFLIWIVLIGFLFYFMMIRPQKRARAQQSDMLQHLQPGAQVRTTAQIMGTIVEVGDDWAIVETTPGTRIKFGKPAIVGIISDDEPQDAEAAEDVPTPGGIGDAPRSPESTTDSGTDSATDSTPGSSSDSASASASDAPAADSEPAGPAKPVEEVKDTEPATS